MTHDIVMQQNTNCRAYILTTRARVRRRTLQLWVSWQLSLRWNQAWTWSPTPAVTTST